MAKQSKKQSTSKRPPKKRVVKDSATPSYGDKTSRADTKGRIVLGAAQANKTFRITEQPNGNVLLEPVVVIHEQEAWLFKNPKALAMVKRGIEQSKAGKTVYLGSFAKYADIKIDDED